jgi:hypothetical protein
MVDIFASALARQLVILAQEGRQPECLQVMSEQNLGRIAHEPAPAIRLIQDRAEVVLTVACGR